MSRERSRIRRENCIEIILGEIYCQGGDWIEESEENVKSGTVFNVALKTEVVHFSESR
jgi:hypothetical protein